MRKPNPDSLETTPATSRWAWLFAPVDNASLAYFRIVFGLIMLWEVRTYFKHDWIRHYWIAPPMNFQYYGFEWVNPLPGAGMYWLFIALGIAACLIVLGLFYRLAAAFFFLGFTYMFLLEQARYLNHFYLVALVAFLLVFLPVHRTWSLDAWLWPETARRSAPAWALWLVRFQIGVPYFFGGVAKINGDWLRGEPMRLWLSRMTDFPVIGRWFTEEWMVYGMSYGGLIFDLLVVPALLWRRTRVPAFALAVGFHLMNDNLFVIGIFPWFMMAASAMYFDPAWPRKILGLVWRAGAGPRGAEPPPPSAAALRVIPPLLAAWIAVQCLVPMRHLLYPGNPSWTEEGHRFAWHMKLRGKSGSARFHVHDPDTGERWVVNPRTWLPRFQERKMIAHPDMILQFAKYVADRKRAAGHPNVEVRADVWISLNGRERQQLIDPTVDLARVRRSLRHATWVLPLATPLRAPTATAAPDGDADDAETE